MDYREFLRVVLPMSARDIREQAAQRPIFNSSYATQLPSVESCLADVLSYEIDFFDNLYLYFVGFLDPKKDMATRSDYSAIDLYHEIKRSIERDINFHNLRSFFVNQGIVPFDHEVIEILRRLDKDDDGTVSLRELDEFLGMIDSAYARSPITITKESVLDKEIENETTITRSVNGNEIETVTKTVTKDDFVRSSPSRFSERTSIRKSYAHRPSHHHHRVTHAHRPHRHYHDVCYASCLGSCVCHDTCQALCTTSCLSPCNLHCCIDTCRPRPTVTREIVVESEIPRRSFSRSLREIRRSESREVREPTTITRVTRRSISPRKDEPITYTTTEVRRSVSRDRDEPVSRTYRSVRRSISRGRPEETVYSTVVRRSVSRDRPEESTYTTTYTRTKDDDKFARTRNSTSRSRKNLEDIEYNSWAKGDPIGSPGKSKRGSIREITSVSSRKSIRRTGRPLLTQSFFRHDH